MKSDTKNLPIKFLNRALEIYRSMMARRWDTTLFGGSGVRSGPAFLKTLEEKGFTEEESYSNRLAMIDGAILAAINAGHNKFPLILKIARLPFAMSLESMTAEQVMAEIQDLNDELQQENLQRNNNNNAKPTTVSSTSNGIADLASQFFGYSLSAYSTCSNWATGLLKDLEFNLKVSHLLIDIAAYANSKFPENVTQKIQDDFSDLCKMLNDRNREMESLQRCELGNAKGGWRVVRGRRPLFLLSGMPKSY